VCSNQTGAKEKIATKKKIMNYTFLIQRTAQPNGTSDKTFTSCAGGIDSNPEPIKFPIHSQ